MYCELHWQDTQPALWDLELDVLLCLRPTGHELPGCLAMTEAIGGVLTLTLRHHGTLQMWLPGLPQAFSGPLPTTDPLGLTQG